MKEYSIKLSEGDIAFLDLLLFFKIDNCKDSLKENLHKNDRKRIEDSFEQAVEIKTKLKCVLSA